MDKYLKRTDLLDFDHPALARLVERKGWAALPPYDAIGAAYGFVRDEIGFGYNASDDLPASRVLRDGYGQCNTKGTLLMALLRAVGVPCRFHGFTIDKKLQKGAITGLAYVLAPANIIHSWVEVQFEGGWVNLEGFILDRPYIDGVRRLFPDAKGPFCGYGISTPDICNPKIDWDGSDTYIQHTGINNDFGLYDAPDDFFAMHGANASGLKQLLFEHIIRHGMNRNVGRVRKLASQDKAAKAMKARTRQPSRA